MEFLKKALFFIVMPVIIPIALLMNLTFDWWVGLYYQKRRLLFYILLPVYAPLALLLNIAFGGWAKLTE